MRQSGFLATQSIVDKNYLIFPLANQISFDRLAPNKQTGATAVRTALLVLLIAFLIGGLVHATRPVPDKRTTIEAWR